MTSDGEPRARETRLKPGPAALLVLAGLLAFGAGPACRRGDPLDDRIAAADGLDFAMWRSGAVGRLSPAQAADVDEAVQQLRYKVMAGGAASGSRAVEDAVFAQMDGLSVRAVLREGLGWEFGQASEEQEAIEASMRQNELLRTKPGDTASENTLVDLHDRQAARLEAARAKVLHARARLAAEGLPAVLADRSPSLASR